MDLSKAKTAAGPHYFPERINDHFTEDSAVRVIHVFVDELGLSRLGFKTMPEATGRP